MYSYLIDKIISCEKRKVCVSKSKIDGAQKCSRMCTCSDFVIQVLKGNNAHDFFPDGMAILFWECKN